MRENAKRVAALLCAVFLIFLFTGLFASVKKGPLGSADVASWVQAVGSIAAILAGIALVYFQLQEAARIRLEDDSLRAYRLLTSLRTEVELLSEKLVAPVGKELQAAEDGRPLFVKMHFVPQQFVVFDSHVAHFGSIASDGLRRILIAGYASFRGLLFSIERNTLTIEALEAEMFAGDGKIPEKRTKIYQNSLMMIRSQVHERYTEASKFVDDFRMALADDVLRSHFKIPSE